MKKFLTKGIIFFLITISILFLFNKLYINTNAFLYSTKESKFYNVPNGIEICNFGSSHGKNAFVYNNMDKTCFNFALGSQGFYYDKRILKQYIDNISNNAIVFIPISYFSFYDGINSTRFDEKNTRYHKFLSKENIINFSFTNYFKYQLIPIIGSGKDKFAIFNDIEIKEKKKTLNNLFSKNEIESIGKRRSNHHLSLIKEGIPYIDECQKELEDMIKICQDKGFQVVLVTTPFNQYYNNGFPENVYDDIYKRINLVKEKYNVPYLDYSHHKDFTYNIDLFLDTDHLNTIGAEKFMEMILNDIKDLLPTLPLD